MSDADHSGYIPVLYLLGDKFGFCVLFHTTTTISCLQQKHYFNIKRSDLIASSTSAAELSAEFHSNVSLENRFVKA